ncbi:AAA family ATPase [Christiangramia sp. OXR-203]|uniref:AAA family ATPase n=1 Tax=Christiangramia sp. OXR-203 TaxID=3100176 RepID=UPI002AC92BA6|nr:AAA family ATPase [Christiangramia sp. OXR-203]WPY97063.1 AAA family ATPase [Christiangramia sp. OXR-203]
MLIKKIKAKNFKTYLNLDLDIATDPDKPIVLIGGANGGGKTTFFDAIYGALYGLNISGKQHFVELLNAGALHEVEKKIELEIHFAGKVLNEDQSYVLHREYMLNSAKKVVEGVRLNMNGTIFSYGSATPPTQRAEQEAQVNKIIKANLPEELSKYFLFDAMEAGNLLKEDRLKRVIKENIENAMGFNKYLSLAKAAEALTQDYTAQSLELEKEKQEYLAIVEEKKAKEEEIKKLDEEHQEAIDYSVSNQEVYDNLKAGLNQESTLKNKINSLESQMDQLQEKEKSYRSDLSDFNGNLETHILLPKLAQAFKNQVSLILKENAENEQSAKEKLSEPFLQEILSKAVNYLSGKGYKLSGVSVAEVAESVLKELKSEKKSSKYDFFESAEIKALEKLVNDPYYNPYPALHKRKAELDLAIKNAQKTQQELEGLKAQVSGKDYSFIQQFEDNEAKIKTLKVELDNQRGELEKLERKIHQYDIPTTEEPDPKFERLKKLQPLFEKIANTLLKSKKEQIQVRMKEDLNANLEAYRDVISKVELSEDLKNLNFKLFHKAGNEIYLSQLNTASTQVVVQVLLKSLHEFGDYDPPVMIDTVMGVLDEKSRSTLLENYFPTLSHQTILLSSDSEIRPESDLPKIEPFISKVFTLERDKELQKTEVTEGYFNYEIAE